MNARWIMTLVALSLLGAGTFAGCVPAHEHQALIAANDRAQSQLKQAQDQLQAALTERGRLEGELSAAREVLTHKNAQIEKLQESRALWETQYNQLLARYEKDTKMPDPPSLGLTIALPPALDRQLQEWVERTGDLVSYDRKRGMVKFKTDLLFAKGSDNVSTEAQTVLAKLAEIVKGADAARFNVYIAGHTDDIPIGSATARRHPTNWYLSVHRAVSVKDVLARAGVPDKRMGVMGFGEFHPVAENAPDKKGNPLNRRVELWIVPPSRLLTIETPEPKS